jgi:hypothetical protein
MRFHDSNAHKIQGTSHKPRDSDIPLVEHLDINRKVILSGDVDGVWHEHQRQMFSATIRRKAL